MGEYVYNYTNGSDPSGTWTNPSNAWDGIDDTYASRNHASGEDDETKRLEGTVNNAPATGGTIIKVEIGVEAWGTSPGNQWYRMRPVFGGTTLGNSYAPPETPDYALPGADTDYTFYVDITNDPNAPSPWTWPDVQALDMRTWFKMLGKDTLTIYVDQLRIRVTTVIPTVGYSYGDGLVTVSVLAMLMRKAILSVCGEIDLHRVR